MMPFRNRRLVTVASNTWVVIEYVPEKNKEGVWVWKRDAEVAGLPRMSRGVAKAFGKATGTLFNGIHNVPLSEVEIKVLSALVPAEVDFRPNEMVPEDYYAG